MAFTTRSKQARKMKEESNRKKLQTLLALKSKWWLSKRQGSHLLRKRRKLESQDCLTMRRHRRSKVAEDLIRTKVFLSQTNQLKAQGSLTQIPRLNTDKWKQCKMSSKRASNDCSNSIQNLSMSNKLNSNPKNWPSRQLNLNPAPK